MIVLREREVSEEYSYYDIERLVVKTDRYIISVKGQKYKNHSALSIFSEMLISSPDATYILNYDFIFYWQKVRHKGKEHYCLSMDYFYADYSGENVTHHYYEVVLALYPLSTEVVFNYELVCEKLNIFQSKVFRKECFI